MEWRKWMGLYGFALLYWATPMAYAQGDLIRKNARPIVLIDPGHGGLDPGAVGNSHTVEKEIALKVAQQMVSLYHELFPDLMEIYLTRYRDSLISLGDRGRLSRELGADLYISIHGNHAPNPKAQGLEVFVWRAPGNVPDSFSAVSERLAEHLMEELRTKLGMKNRGLKEANFQVLRDNRNQCPAVLVELGFLSNGEEADYLKSKRGIQALALAILSGISNYRKDAGSD